MLVFNDFCLSVENSFYINLEGESSRNVLTADIKRVCVCVCVCVCVLGLCYVERFGPAAKQLSFCLAVCNGFISLFFTRGPQLFCATGVFCAVTFSAGDDQSDCVASTGGGGVLLPDRSWSDRVALMWCCRRVDSRMATSLLCRGTVAQCIALLPHSKKPVGSSPASCNMSGLVPGPFCVEFACSPRVHLGSPHRTPQQQKHAKKADAQKQSCP